MADGKFHHHVLEIRKIQLEKMRMRELGNDIDLTEQIGLLTKT
jgi:hypothetical protein